MIDQLKVVRKAMREQRKAEDAAARRAAQAKARAQERDSWADFKTLCAPIKGR
jgi:hypothetical protein